MTIASLAAHFDAEVEYQIFKGSGLDMRLKEAGRIDDIFKRINNGDTLYTTETATIWCVSSFGVLKIYI